MDNSKPPGDRRHADRLWLFFYKSFLYSGHLGIYIIEVGVVYIVYRKGGNWHEQGPNSSK